MTRISFIGILNLTTSSLAVLGRKEQTVSSNLKFYLIHRIIIHPQSFTLWILVWPSSIVIPRQNNISHTGRGRVWVVQPGTWASTHTWDAVRHMEFFFFSGSPLWDRPHLFRAITAGWSRVTRACFHVFSARKSSLAGPQGGHQQTEVWKDWWKEADYAD